MPRTNFFLWHEFLAWLWGTTGNPLTTTHSFLPFNRASESLWECDNRHCSTATVAVDAFSKRAYNICRSYVPFLQTKIQLLLCYCNVVPLNYFLFVPAYRYRHPSAVVKKFNRYRTYHDGTRRIQVTMNCKSCKRGSKALG